MTQLDQNMTVVVLEGVLFKEAMLAFKLKVGKFKKREIDWPNLAGRIFCSIHSWQDLYYNDEVVNTRRKYKTVSFIVHYFVLQLLLLYLGSTTFGLIFSKIILKFLTSNTGTRTEPSIIYLFIQCEEVIHSTQIYFSRLKITRYFLFCLFFVMLLVMLWCSFFVLFRAGSIY